MSEQPTVDCVLDIHAQSGETPVWSSTEQCLYWVDQLLDTLNRFDPTSGVNSSWQLPAHISSFALREQGRPVLVALQSGLFDLDPLTRAVTPVVVPPPYDQSAHRFNDGRCDRQGRYIVGSVDLSYMQTGVRGRASLYRLDGATVTPIVDGLTVTNGLAFSPDGRTMYVADTASGTVFAFDYDIDAGTPSNRREFVTLSTRVSLLDGADVDAEGGYWIALLTKGAIARYSPDGTLDRIIEMPGTQPTKVCFGGADLSTLFITTAAHRYVPTSEPSHPNNGGIFAVQTGSHGMAEPLLAS